MTTTITDTIAASLDPVAFACRVGVEPDDYQARALRSTARQALWNWCRQSGKSTTAALITAHTALFTPGVTCLVAAPSERQSGETLAKVKATVRHFDHPDETALQVRLSNGSRVIALPGGEGNLRGFTAALVVIDEASRLPDETYSALRPMLAVSRGRLIAISTPYGARGFWWNAWADGGAGWERSLVTWRDVPRIDRATIEAERRSLGGHWFAQEWEGTAVSAADSVFPLEDIQAAMGAW